MTLQNSPKAQALSVLPKPPNIVSAVKAQPTAPTPLLTSSEQEAFGRCEKVISISKAHFLVVATALAEIRDKKLYRGNFKTFEDYLYLRWGFCRAHGYRLIQTSAICKEITASLNTGIKMPGNEKAFRELVRIKKAEDRASVLKEAWAATTEGDVSAAKIRSVAEAKGILAPRQKPASSPLLAVKNALSEIEEAVRSGISKEELLKKIARCKSLAVGKSKQRKS